MSSPPRNIDELCNIVQPLLDLVNRYDYDRRRRTLEKDYVEPASRTAGWIIYEREFDADLVFSDDCFDLYLGGIQASLDYRRLAERKIDVVVNMCGGEREKRRALLVEEAKAPVETLYCPEAEDIELYLADTEGFFRKYLAEEVDFQALTSTTTDQERAATGAEITSGAEIATGAETTPADTSASIGDEEIEKGGVEQTIQSTIRGPTMMSAGDNLMRMNKILHYIEIPAVDTLDEDRANTKPHFQPLCDYLLAISVSKAHAFQSLLEKARKPEAIDPARKKTNVLVHCVEGRNRSAVMVCAFLIRYRGWTAAEAVDQVARNRDARILVNRRFLRQLQEWQEVKHDN